MNIREQFNSFYKSHFNINFIISKYSNEIKN